MSDTITVKVEAVTAKRTGENNGKAWTLYHITTRNVNGQPSLTLSTFEGGWINLIGKTVETTYESVSSKDGRYTNHNAGELKDAKVLNGSAPAVREPSVPQTGFTAEDRSSLSEILYLLKELRAKFA